MKYLFSLILLLNILTIYSQTKRTLKKSEQNSILKELLKGKLLKDQHTYAWKVRSPFCVNFTDYIDKKGKAYTAIDTIHYLSYDTLNYALVVLKTSQVNLDGQFQDCFGCI